MKNTKIILLGLMGAGALALPMRILGAPGGVEGSVHDFSTNSLYSAWNTRHTVCTVCHAAHHTDESTPQTAPLWAHATTTNTFTPYTSLTLNASVGQPDGVSLACLSCHDGSLAINQGISGPRGGGTNMTQRIQDIAPEAQIGPDLHNVHPISFVYNSALATADGQLEDPDVYKIGAAKTRLTVTTAPVKSTGWEGTSLSGKTITDALLDQDKKMQCTSCHDVHRLAGNSPSSGILIRISGTDVDGRGDLICRTCHVK